MSLKDLFDISILTAGEDTEDQELADDEMDLETGEDEKVEGADEEDDPVDDEPEEEETEACESGCDDEKMTPEEKAAFFSYILADDGDDVPESDDDEVVEEEEEVVESEDLDTDMEDLGDDVEEIESEDDLGMDEDDMDTDMEDLGDDLDDEDEDLEEADMTTMSEQPTHIEPGQPIPTNYYGPGPDAGLNIANFFCPACAESVDVGTLNPITADNVFCPMCATNMVYKADSGEERIAALYDEVDDGTLIAAGVCPQHGEILTDTIEAGAESYCPFCGQVLLANTEDVVPEVTAKVLTDPAKFTDLVPSDVTLACANADTHNPTGHIIVKDEPVAQIRFASFKKTHAGAEQVEDEQLLKLFKGATYEKALTDAICAMGLMDVLQTQDAEIYTAAVDDAEKFQQYRTAAAIEAQKDYREKAASVIDRFSRCLQLVSDGMERGAYDKTMGNPLVRTVASAFKQHGIHDPVTRAQTAVKAGMGEHIANMFAQALRYMEMDDEALTHVASYVESVDFTPTARTADTADSHTISLQDELVRTSVPLIATDVAPTAPNFGSGDPSRNRYKNLVRGIHGRMSSHRR